MLPVQATDSRIFAQLSVTDAAFSDTRQQYRANRIGSRSVKQISTIGLDLAKNVFQIHGTDAEGAPVLNRKLRRVEVLRYFEKLPPCLVGLEACGGSHYWAREMAGLYAPYRRFADVLADAGARIGGDVGCYSFIAVDFHHILLASLPAHSLALRPAHSRCHQFVTRIPKASAISLPP